MNPISYFFIVLFGIAFGYVFPDLLEELGLSKQVSHSWIAVFLLAFLSLAGFVLYPLLIFGSFTFNNIYLFYSQSNGIFLGIAVALIAGGAANLGYRAFRERK